MKQEKKWQIVNQLQFSASDFSDNSQETEEKLIQLLLENRGIITKEDAQEFLHPSLDKVTPDFVGIDKKQLQKAIQRVRDAIEKNEQVVIFGDYDVDGITASAILWESFQSLGTRVMPYIPHRVGEGYGLSEKGIDNVLVQYPDTKLLVTVDNGIVANEAVAYANQKGLDVIITDHHTLGDQLPDAYAIVHTTKLCGAGVGWIFSQEFRSVTSKRIKESQNGKEMAGEPLVSLNDNIVNEHLALVALATVADLVPLTGANRTLLIHGLKELQKTTRPGLLALCSEAELAVEKIDVYAIGHIIGPRLNAMGRMESAMDSLRLLCTKDRLKAKVLADKLGSTNKERQDITKALTEHAITFFKNGKTDGKKLLFIAHESYEEGVIGLVAGKLVEQYYRPAIVLSIGEKISKASARSVAGFNIIEFIRSASTLLVNAGGHPMAAGFTIETEKILLLQEKLEQLAEKSVDGDMLTRVVKIDCALPVEGISQNMYDALQTLAPFGMGNFEPTFTSEVVVTDIKKVGQDGKHLKLVVGPVIASGDEKSPSTRLGVMFPAIAFGQGELGSKIKAGETIQIAYTIDENVWRDKKSLQLKIKDIHLH